jgi:L-2-hydroxyglutarate oxidase
MATADLVVVGGGIVGLATALAATRRLPGRSVLVLEKEPRLAAHQTGNNSGVIHSGLYYRPGSLKASNCVRGRELLERFCSDHGVPFERCGKLVVATRPEQVGALEELERRGRANGLDGLVRLGPDGLRDREPHVAGVAGLQVLETGIVDYVRVAEAYADEIRRGGGGLLTGTRLRRVRRLAGELLLETSAGELRCRFLVNCAGLHSDRVARRCGVDPGVRIVPFRGEYYELTPDRCHLIRHLVYPVPDPAFPFLGVHFTRMIRGGVEAGPNAVLALKREGYSRFSFAPVDTLSTLLWPGFWRLARRFLRTGLAEQWRSLSKAAFVRALAELVPEITAVDVRRSGAGVRAQALDRHGNLLDDFCLVDAERMVHVLNAPSPAATASLAIGETIAERVLERFG